MDCSAGLGRIFSHCFSPGKHRKALGPLRQRDL
jgi:hypothetical protein